jgi:hypothetical protein
MRYTKIMLAGFLALACGLWLSPTSARADGVKLEDAFKWVQKSDNSFKYVIGGTLTIHGPGAQSHHRVHLAVGDLTYSWDGKAKGPSHDFLVGTLRGYSTDDNNGLKNLFSFPVKISRTGQMSVGMQVGGKDFLGRPAANFQPTQMSGGLLTKVLPKGSSKLFGNSDTVITLTLDSKKVAKIQ